MAIFIFFICSRAALYRGHRQRVRVGEKVWARVREGESRGGKEGSGREGGKGSRDSWGKESSGRGREMSG